MKKPVDDCAESEVCCVTVMKYFDDNDLRYVAEKIIEHLNNKEKHHGNET